MMNRLLLKRRRLVSILALLLILLQIPLWIGRGSLFSLLYTYYEQYQVIRENSHWSLANDELIDKIAALKAGTAEIGARARLELGMVGKGETYYQIVNPQ